MAEERLCISCKWFRITIEGHRWSDWTPGSPSYVGCAASSKTDKPYSERKNHWGFNPGDPDDGYQPVEGKPGETSLNTDITDYYRKMLRTAQTCPDYKTCSFDAKVAP